ncbi:ATP-binding protein [Rheinheimera sp.]|uniref:ATP-binding protein n=1 Tax=Rheinheimera sp. TaxID=1869214 RepID=UPI0040482E85
MIVDAEHKGGRKIRIMGEVRGKHSVYESFKVIPLSLLQNAIKYGRTGDVEIVFDERDSELTFSVVSYGDLIPEHELEKIFSRGYRTEKAKKMAVEGNGLGLYALKVVAEAHGFGIEAKSTPHGDRTRNEAKNIFSVFIR